MSVIAVSVTGKAQADGAQTLDLPEGGFTNQINISGTATSGTITFDYYAFGEWKTLLKNGAALVVDMASNTKSFLVYGCLDKIRATPTSIAGGTYSVQIISEVL